MGSGTLWATCACMFGGAYLTGLLPLWGSATGNGGEPSSRSAAARFLNGPPMRLLTAGLMMGSGLGVVVPEGFMAFAEGAEQAAPCKSLQPQQPGALPEWTAGGAMLVGFLGMLLLQLWQEGAANTHDHGHGHGHGQGHGQQGGYTAVTRTDSDMAEAGGGLGTAAGLTTAAMHRKEVASGGSGSGGALHVEALAAEERGEGPGAGGGGAGVGGAGGKGSSNPRLALGGLLVHSAADGVAVGAASLAPGPALTLVVALSIMLHKLPVTFGLTSYLQHAGWARRQVLNGLLYFAASAPVAALLTHYLLALLLGWDPVSLTSGPPGPADAAAAAATAALPPVGEAGAGAGAEGAHGPGQAVALAVLLSGGTFLAAATQHILPAALQTGGAVGPGEGGGRAAAAGGAGGAMGMVWLAVGALFPLVIAALLPED